ncbi:MAG TPA: Ig-like domain-containing protein, partial [Pseudolabrys sp.]|nr:Ig-like domain-containing protein [Pseudolabrys sp.]
VAQGQNPGGKVTNVTFENNHLGAGTYGTLDLRTELGDQPTISGNIDDGRTLAQSLTTTGQPPAGSTTGSPPPAPTPSPAPSATTIASYSQDSGVKGDGITNDSTLTLNGTAAANGVVKIVDGTSQIGTATANSSGTWSYTTPTLADGSHSIVAKVTDAAGTTTASAALAVTIDTVAPHAPTIAATLSGNAVTDVSNVDHVTLAGTAEANSTVQVFDGTKQIGTATANASGAWSDSVGSLTDGSHSFTAKAVDAAANTSAASSATAVTVHDPAAASSSVAFTDAHKNSNGTVTLTGTAGDNSHVNIYGDSAIKAMGTVTANADGAWSFTTTSAVSNMVHTFTAKTLDSAGNVVGSSGQADIGSTHRDSIVSSLGNDIMAGGSGQDTFTFAASFGKDVITDFRSSGYNHDIIQLSKSVFDNFADVLSHATQSGHDVVIAGNAGDTLTLKQTALSDLHKSDFHIA